MICPEKSCNAEIPDDSFYCDQCGIKILRCQKCNSVGTRNFCSKCGGVMIFTSEDNIQILGASPSVTDEKKSVYNQKIQRNNSIQNEISPSKPTQIISLNLGVPSLELCNTSDGWKLIAKDGNILGRETGEFVSLLCKIPVISGRHAQVLFKDNKWYITDLHSTNGTFINSKRLSSDTPTEIKDGDLLVLANVSFVAKNT